MQYLRDTATRYVSSFLASYVEGETQNGVQTKLLSGDFKVASRVLCRSRMGELSWILAKADRCGSGSFQGFERVDR